MQLNVVQKYKMFATKLFLAFLIVTIIAPGSFKSVPSSNSRSEPDEVARMKRQNVVSDEESDIENWMSDVEEETALPADVPVRVESDQPTDVPVRVESDQPADVPVRVESDQPADEDEFQVAQEENELASSVLDYKIPPPEEADEEPSSEPFDQARPIRYDEEVPKQVYTPRPQAAPTATHVVVTVKTHKQLWILFVGVLVLLILLIVFNCVNTIITFNSAPMLEDDEVKKTKKKAEKSKKKVKSKSTKKAMFTDASSAGVTDASSPAPEESD